MQISQLMTLYTHQILIKYDEDISANLYQKCLILLILYNKILLNLLHNMNSKLLLPWQHTGFQTSPILKAFLAISGVPFWYLQMVPRINDTARLLLAILNNVSSSTWPHLIFLESSGWGLEKSYLPWKQHFL